MTTLQKRKQVSDFLSKKADDKFINMVYAMMMEYFDQFKPMTDEAFLERNKRSQKDIKAGRLVSQGDVRRKFSTNK